ncbi:LysE family translocator [Algicella marina]|uniref:LysE family translocator n=1 Tax=Algicella marina TaxID=2683284 RepID=A0A6P1T6S0_9RHOB|nr:LysE family translocator [Algicella marina]QHQ36969.1 LysE family translocator [Algicella marina]
MHPETLLTLAGIFAASVWTPGPNNAMLAASGATFGFRRTVPHLLGVALGFPVMIFCVGLGLGFVFEAFPVLKDLLRIIGIALLLWVAWKIATMASASRADREAQPFTFLQAAAFQWVNPKAWAMAISIVSVFVSPDHVLLHSLIVAVVSAALGLTSASGWTGFGHAMQRVLARPGRLRAFNLVMAGTILLGVAYLVRDALI